MTTEEERKPAYGRKKFHCPYCDVFTHQEWVRQSLIYPNGTGQGAFVELHTTQCFDCKHFAVWYKHKMIDPFASSAPQADSGMPDSVKEIFDEARQVQEHSPRAAAALLRLALEELTVHLGETDGKLDTRIGNLQKKGFLSQVIKGLDSVRITGNEGGAHIGKIDLTGADGAEVVNKLFWLVNFIVQRAINDLAEADRIFDDLPADKLEGVKNRDKPKETQ